MFEKFKEREPLDTVNVIKALFNKLSPDFEIKVESEMGEDIKVFSCAVRLYYKGKLILRANGKGMKREFALASGYAELFERFSNELNVDGFFYPYLDSTYGEDVEVFEELKYFPQCEDCTDLVKTFLLEEAPDVRAVRYKNLTGGADALIDPRHMLIINGTNGMAAGNTLTEALNQGLSELCERYVITRAYNGDMKFDEIPMSMLKDIAPESYEKSLEIIKKGFD